MNRVRSWGAWLGLRMQQPQRRRHKRASRLFSSLFCAASVAAAGMTTGCGFSRQTDDSWAESNVGYYESASTQIEYPDVETPINPTVLDTAAPLSIVDDREIEYEFMSLQEAVQKALMNSRVLRDLGGTVLRSPDDIDTNYDVALRELDPRFGVAAALSEFDAQFAFSASHEKNDRALNNQDVGALRSFLKQDNSIIQSQLTKRAATGTELTFRNLTEYDYNNTPSNRFISAPVGNVQDRGSQVWETLLDMEVRQPLLQGNGSKFLRIAGPTATAGSVNGNLTGVVIARIRTDITLTEFEAGVRDFVSNVENAYWDLYFAYRNLDTKIVARDTALQTWNRVNALYQAGRVGGEAEKEAQAREQYFRFQQEVQDALSGRLSDWTRTNSGSGGGSFRGTQNGVMTAERRLRLLLGEQINTGSLLRPSDEPILAQVEFDWDSILVEAMTRRPELRRQKWIVKQREQELIAAQNFLLPELDVVGRYRWRGMGHDLLEQHGSRGRFDNAWGNFLTGDYQEWQLGLELAVPIGFRRAHAAVEFSELNVARERVVLGEQEREVVHALSNAVSELGRAWKVLETTEDRRLSSAAGLESVQAAFDADKIGFDVVLESQRRFFAAEIAHYQALVDYSLAIRNVHYEKGSLLDYNEIYLTEDLWPMKAYQDAMNRRENSLPAEWMHTLINSPQPVSAGPYYQNVTEEGEMTWSNQGQAGAGGAPGEWSATEVETEGEGGSPVAPVSVPPEGGLQYDEVPPAPMPAPADAPAPAKDAGAATPAAEPAPAANVKPAENAKAADGKATAAKQKTSKIVPAAADDRQPVEIRQTALLPDDPLEVPPFVVREKVIDAASNDIPELDLDATGFSLDEIIPVDDLKPASTER
jgi:outer membrane protein TolC